MPKYLYFNLFNLTFKLVKLSKIKVRQELTLISIHSLSLFTFPISTPSKIHSSQRTFHSHTLHFWQGVGGGDLYLYCSFLVCIKMANLIPAITGYINQIIALCRQHVSNETEIDSLFGRIDILVVDHQDEQWIISNMVDLFKILFAQAANHALPNYGFDRDNVNYVRGLFLRNYHINLDIALPSDHIGCVLHNLHRILCTLQSRLPECLKP